MLANGTTSEICKNIYKILKKVKKSPQFPGGFFHNLKIFKEPGVEGYNKNQRTAQHWFQRQAERVLLNRRYAALL